MTVLKAAVLWFAILILAVVNGLAREALLIPAMGLEMGQALSGVILGSVIFLMACIFAPWLGPLRQSAWVAIGGGWLLMTLIFEFGFGFAQGKSWSVMLAAYRFQDGNLWPLVLVMVLLSPWLGAVLRGKVRRH